MEEMDLTELYTTYERIRKNQESPRQMFKIVIYAAMTVTDREAMLDEQYEKEQKTKSP